MEANSSNYMQVDSGKVSKLIKKKTFKVGKKRKFQVKTSTTKKAKAKQAVEAMEVENAQ